MTRSVGGPILGLQRRAPQRCETVTWIERSQGGDSRVELVQRARRGDAVAFDRLAANRIDDAYRLAVAILRSEDDARDAVQDAFVSAWRQIRGLRDPSRFDAWLDRILVNACRMALRHRRTVRVHEIGVEGSLAVGAGQAAAVAALDDGAADAELVRHAFRQLSGDHRALLVLHHVQDRPLDEIAAVLGVPVGTVKWRLHAAREALRRAVAEESR